MERTRTLLQEIKLLILSLFLLTNGLYLQAQEKIKFLVFSDLHYDLMPGGEDRLLKIIGQAEKNKVDFIMDLGDLAFAIPRNDTVRKILNSTPIPQYHVIGNHDLDLTNKTTYMNFWRMPASYYYIDRGKFRLIILDSNFFEDKQGTVKPYDSGNYYVDGSKRELYSREETDWLKNLLMDTTHICLLFSHGPINDDYSAVSKNKAIHEIITGAKKSGTRIAAVFGGHIHSDNFHRIDDVNYVQINSASYIWGGEEFQNTSRYPDSLYHRYKQLKYIIPYQSALYAIIEVSTKGNIKIRGVKSQYLKPEPDKRLLKEKKPYPCSPVISNRELTY